MYYVERTLGEDLECKHQVFLEESGPTSESMIPHIQPKILKKCFQDNNIIINNDEFTFNGINDFRRRRFDGFAPSSSVCLGGHMTERGT